MVGGYSRLVPGDEKENFTELRRFLTAVVEPQITEFGGNIFKETAELVLVDFDDVVMAARCAAGLRDAVVQMNQALPDEQRIAMRIGLNFGDVIAEDGDVFGDGVNIAARVGALAKPGSVYVSEMVHNRVADAVDFDFEDLGPQDLKNISRPIRVYRMAGEMAELSEDLLAAGVRLAARAPAFDNRRAIAVLPFANFSGDPEQEFFADGITEDIISMLAGWRAFPVIARASTFTYKGKTVDIKKVGEELGVRYVLEGSVRKSGHRVRVTAQLIQADTGHHIMAERYDRDLTDLFELQDEITHAIAGAIEPELLKFERDRIAERPQHSEDAYELYQRGMLHHYRQNKADNIEAQAYFRRALAIDPQYPQATAASFDRAICARLYSGGRTMPRLFRGRVRPRATGRYPRPALSERALRSRPGVHVDAPPRARDRGVRGGDQAQSELCRRPTFCSARCTSTPVGRKRRSSRRKRAFDSAPPIRACSSGFPRWPAHTTRWGIILRLSKPGRRSWSFNRNWPHGLRYVVAGLGPARQDRRRRGGYSPSCGD